MLSRLDSRQLAERLRMIRIELFGDDGIPILSSQLGIPENTWVNYERGVLVPGVVLLHFIELTSVDPHWMATGEGPHLAQKSPRLDLNPGKQS